MRSSRFILSLEVVVKTAASILAVGSLLGVAACTSSVSQTPHSFVPQGIGSFRTRNAFPAAVTYKEFKVPTTGAGPSKIVFGPNGAYWFTEFNAGKIGQITTAGKFTEYNIPTTGSKPDSITVGPDNNVWFTEAGGDKIGRITTAGRSGLGALVRRKRRKQNRSHDDRRKVHRVQSPYGECSPGRHRRRTR